MSVPVDSILSFNADYLTEMNPVVEWGTKSGWLYQKRKNGLTEMWKTVTASYSGSSWASTNGMNRAVKKYELPFDVTDDDLVYAGASGVTSGVFTVVNPEIVTTGEIEIQALRGSGTGGATIKTTIYVVANL